MAQAAMAIALLAGAVAELWNPPPYRRWPWLTLGAVVLVSLSVVLRVLRPELFSLLPPDRRMPAGEWWRVGSALFLPGRSPVSDLAWLLVLGTMAERRFSRWTWLTAFLAGGVAATVVATLWQQGLTGASFGCFALAGALCSDWREGRWRWWRVAAGLLGTSAAAFLLMGREVQGIAFLVGLALGFGLAVRASMARKVEFRDNVVPITRTETYH